MTDSRVYPPSEDTFLLLEAALSEERPGDRVLEAGCGSGYISSRLSREVSVIACDINPHAVRLTQSLGVDVVRADLLSGIRGPFDLVIFNPPYLPTLPEERMDDWLEYALDGGEDGTRVIRRFAEQVERILAPYGRVLLLLSSLTGLHPVRDLFVNCGFATDVVRECRVEGEDLFVLKCTRVGEKQA